MPAANHPAYKEELGRCRSTLGYVEKTLDSSLVRKTKIDSEIEGSKKHFNSESSEDYVNLMISTMLADSLTLKIRNLKTALGKPYFARVDFVEDGKKEAEKLYIGKMSLMKEEDKEVVIIDWRAPVANLYYEGRLGDAAYDCPDGNIEGQLVLKRQFSINDGELQEIFDIDITTNDEFLQAYLGAGADNRLKEIVSTIQVEQNQIIRADMWKPLVVQGAAGSGKTTIALHRIAYLIYMYEKNFKPESFMIIAPNTLFLNYISEVLPELGVERVRQSTFESFATLILGKKHKVRDQNEKLSTLVSKTIEEASVKLKSGKNSTPNLHGLDFSEYKRLLRSSAEFKASMDFKELIDRFITKVERRFIPPNHFEIEGQVIFTYFEINKLFLNEYKHMPLLKRVNEIKKHLNNRLKVKKEAIVKKLHEDSDMKVFNLKESMEDNEERHELIVEAIDTRNYIIERIEKYSKTAINEYVKAISKASPLQYYEELMSDIEAFKALGKGLAEEDTLEFLATYTGAVLAAGEIELEDYAPLIYLKYQIDGIDEKLGVKHVIIDEAQDFSVFQLYALKKILKDSSYTILGDLSQAIHSYRGIKDWKDVLEQVFHEGKAIFMTLEQSYRTSVEIMEAANLVIDRIKLDGLVKAKPVMRHGLPVKYLQDKPGQYEIALETFRGMQERGLKSIAFICKSTASCEKAFKHLKTRVSGLSYITGKEDQYKGGVVLVSSFLSKGLEFDGVIVLNADEFEESELDLKLLYVAMTRAMHELYVVD